MDDETLIGAGKADFTRIYDRPDPRAYYATLAPLDYRIPELARPVVDAAVDAAKPSTVLDVCCSYGINAMLLRHEIGFAAFAERCVDAAGLSPEAVIEADQRFFSSRRSRRPDLRMVGLDAAQPAIDYAVTTGLMADGWAENLEEADPTPALTAGLRDVEMIISTGGVGYVGRPTFERLVEAAAKPDEMWALVFVLRVFDYSDIAAVFDDHGLITERLDGVTFRQRRFADRAEYEVANHDVALRGLDPAGKEAAGWYHADCFVTRPAAEAARTSLADLLAGSLPDVS
jgi:hypothetical protein